MDTNYETGSGHDEDAQNLRRRLAGLVDDQAPSELMRARTWSRVGAARRSARVRRYGLVGGVAAAAVLAIVTFAPGSTDEVTVEVTPRDTTVADLQTTTTAQTGVDTETEATVLGAVEFRESSTTSIAAGTDLAPGRAYPVTDCRNSGDPACGPFYWDPTPPPDEPLTIDASLSAQTVAVGQTVVLTNVVADPDAQNLDDWVQWGDEDATLIPPATEVLCIRYGPWDTPPAAPGRAEYTHAHAYHQPGTYSVLVYVQSFRTREVDCYDEFDDVATVTLTINVV